MVGKIVGYREFDSKKGNTCRLLTLMTPYSDREKEKGAVGNRTDDIFLPDACKLKITEASIGQDAVVEYSVSGGRAYVENVVLKKA